MSGRFERGYSRRKHIHDDESQGPKENAQIVAGGEKPIFKSRMNQACHQNSGQGNRRRKDIPGPVHLPKSASYVRSKEEDQGEERNIAHKSDPLRNRQVAIAMFSSGLAERFEAFRLPDHLAAGRTGAKTAAQPWMRVNNRNRFVPNGFARCENPILAMTLVQKN